MVFTVSLCADVSKYIPFAEFRNVKTDFSDLQPFVTVLIPSVSAVHEYVSFKLLKFSFQEYHIATNSISILNLQVG